MFLGKKKNIIEQPKKEVKSDETNNCIEGSKRAAERPKIVVLVSKKTKDNNQTTQDQNTITTQIFYWVLSPCRIRSWKLVDRLNSVVSRLDCYVLTGFSH